MNYSKKVSINKVIEISNKIISLDFVKEILNTAQYKISLVNFIYSDETSISWKKIRQKWIKGKIARYIQDTFGYIR